MSKTIQEAALDTPVIAANFPRASAGYSHDTLLRIVGEGYYACSTGKASDTLIGHRSGELALVQAAAKTLRGYGMKVRVSKQDRSLTVFGPKRGCRAGSYSA